MLSFKNRFHGHGSLRYVYKNGQAVRGRLATLKHTPNPRRKTPRVAVVVSKKVYKRAVGRNRIRRRVYETVRHALPTLDPHCDLVFIVASSELLTISQDDLDKTISQLLASAHIYKNLQ